MILFFTVTFRSNAAHNLTRSPTAPKGCAGEGARARAAARAAGGRRRRSGCRARWSSREKGGGATAAATRRPAPRRWLSGRPASRSLDATLLVRGSAGSTTTRDRHFTPTRRRRSNARGAGSRLRGDLRPVSSSAAYAAAYAEVTAASRASSQQVAVDEEWARVALGVFI